jgi:hypothetical protein
VAGDGRIVLTWEPPEHDEPIGYRYGRDGVDAGGAGPWSGMLPATARTATLDKLVNGRAYAVTVAAVYPAEAVPASVTVTPVARPSDPPPVPRGTAWLSGVADDDVTRINGWGGWRGQAVTYVRSWADSGESNQTTLPRMKEIVDAGYRGVLEMCVGGPSDWAGAARGGHDEVWTKTCRRAHVLYGGLRGLDLSMAHEFNNGYPWIVRADQQANFRLAWARWYAIVQRELVAKGRAVRVVLPCNGDTNSGWTVKDGLPALGTFDVLGVDPYNFWPSVSNAAEWSALATSWKGGTPRGVVAWADYAESIGKPLSVGEWGLAPSGKFPVDVPFYITAMREFFAARAPRDPYKPGPGEIAGEAYFNAWEGHGRLWPTATNASNSRAAYLALNWGAPQ